MLKNIIFLIIISIEGLYAVIAEMKINEILYYQVLNGNNEFIEFYVTASGDLDGYIVADQDGSSKQYRFPSHMVSQGDYVVFYTTMGIDTVVGNVHYFYHNQNGPYYNDGGDEVLLLQPSSTDMTMVDGDYLNAIPWDYVAYSDSGDGIPTSINGVTLFWNSSFQNELKRDTIVQRSQSISLSPNGIDGDTSACWEATGSGNASDNGCSGYVKSVDATSDASLTYSMGRNNTDVPSIKLEKTSLTIYDPVNIQTNPKAIPGALVAYTISARNEGFGSTDANTIAIADTVPANMKLCVSSVGRCTQTNFLDGGVSSTLSLGSLEYSNNNGVSFNYTPIADAEGFDAEVTNIRIKLNGSFEKSDGVNHPSFSLALKMGIL